MEPAPVVIQPIQLADLPAITRMTFANMTGVDHYFTQLTTNPLARAATYLTLPFYLGFSGRGYKAIRDRQMVGCAFMHLRFISAYIYNVSVNRPYRRQGIGRLLMDHLEQEARQNGKSWLALQVDDGNKPAQHLYDQLGFRAYHPQLLRWDSQLPIQKAIADGIQVSPLSQYSGRLFYRRFRDREIQSGDPWFAQVLNDYDLNPADEGSYWSCQLHDKDVGCAWILTSGRRLKLRLACEPDYWGHGTIVSLVQLLTEAVGASGGPLDLYLVSSAHHRAAERQLTPIGFSPLNQTRIFMFKNLAADPLR